MSNWCKTHYIFWKNPFKLTFVAFYNQSSSRQNTSKVIIKCQRFSNYTTKHVKIHQKVSEYRTHVHCAVSNAWWIIKTCQKLSQHVKSHQKRSVTSKNSHKACQTHLVFFEVSFFQLKAVFLAVWLLFWIDDLFSFVSNPIRTATGT